LSNQEQSWHYMSLRARGFISVVTAAGVCVLGWGVVNWSSREPAKFFCYLLVALLASRLKVHLPGITGTICWEWWNSACPKPWP